MPDDVKKLSCFQSCLQLRTAPKAYQELVKHRLLGGGADCSCASTEARVSTARSAVCAEEMVGNEQASQPLVEVQTAHPAAVEPWGQDRTHLQKGLCLASVGEHL